MRTDKILNVFHRLQKNINEWEMLIRSSFPHSSIEINQRFNLLTKDVASLSNQTLLAAVSTVIHRDILNLGDILTRIKQLGLRKVEPGIEQSVQRTDTRVESSFSSMTNLSGTAPPVNRVQDVEVEGQNLSCSEPSINHAFEGRNVKLI